MPGPQHPEVSLSMPLPGPGQNASRLTRAELQPGSPRWGGESARDLSFRARFLKPLKSSNCLFITVC